MRVNGLALSFALAASSALSRPCSPQVPTVGVHPALSLKAQVVSDPQLTHRLNTRILNASELLGERQFSREGRADLTVRVLAVSRESRSAQDSVPDQGVHDLYIAVSESDELPRERLYQVGPVYEPKLDSLVLFRGSPAAFVSDGTRQVPRRKACIRIITLNWVMVQPATLCVPER
jgi:hypothetical protein